MISQTKILSEQLLVDTLRAACDQVHDRLWIAVPYLGSARDILKIIGTRWQTNKNVSFRLLTDIDEVNRISSETIKLFKDFGEIRHLSALHAKLYIIDNDVLLTSANLTGTAFMKRYEIGAFLQDQEAKDVITTFEKWWKKAQPVSDSRLKRAFIVDRKSEEEETGKRYPDLWSLPDEDYDQVDYWIKPIGSTESPIEINRLFGSENQNLHFSKQKPSGVKIGDILIVYGVGVQRVLSIYKITSEPKKLTKANFREGWNERWPWFVESLNLTPRFGLHWNEHNLYVKDLVDEFLQKNPLGYITKVRGQNLKALNYGKDKIKLDPAFADFVISKVRHLASRK